MQRLAQTPDFPSAAADCRPLGVQLEAKASVRTFEAPAAALRRGDEHRQPQILVQPPLAHSSHDGRSMQRFKVKHTAVMSVCSARLAQPPELPLRAGSAATFKLAFVNPASHTDSNVMSTVELSLTPLPHNVPAVNVGGRHLRVRRPHDPDPHTGPACTVVSTHPCQRPRRVR